MEGIVVRAYPSGESDLVLRVITDAQGKIAVFAPRARRSMRRFSAKIDVLDYGYLELKKGRGALPMLAAFNSLSAFPGLRGDLDRLSTASMICEAFDLLLPEEGHEAQETFHVLLLSLRSIDKAEGLRSILRTSFLTLATLLNITGFDTNQAGGQPTRRNFLALLDQIESLAERRLATRSALEAALQRLDLAEKSDLNRG